MNKTNPPVLSFLYGICTLITVIIWIFWPDLSYYIGAASIMQLFVFAVGNGNKYTFIVLLVVVLVFASGLAFAVRSAYKKHQYKMLTVLMWLDVIISSVLLVYNLSMQNYISTVYHVAFGIIVRGLFAIYFSWKVKTEHISSCPKT